MNDAHDGNIARFLLPALAFLLTAPLSFFLGVTFVFGHARLLPYVSVWIDRLVFVVIVFGVPILVAVGVARMLRSRCDKDAEKMGTRDE